MFVRDLAVDLRLKLGDWFRVVQLLKSGGGGGMCCILGHVGGYDGTNYRRRYFAGRSLECHR